MVCNLKWPLGSVVFDLTILGIVSTQIVGVRFYRGRANPNERVQVIRDANNQYDWNAIKVENVMGAQIGHIPRQMAAKLASYMVYSPNLSLWPISDCPRMLVTSLLKER